jgi:hypothetical protein
MRPIHTRFLCSADLRRSAITCRILGILFLLVGLVAGGLLLYDRFVEQLALRAWFSGWDWLLLLGAPVGLILLLLSGARSRQAVSLRRIEASGIPAWGRVTRVRQAGEKHGFRQVYLFRLHVSAEGSAVFEATAIDYLPIRDAQLHAWTELYEHWLPVLLDPQDRDRAKILWNDPRVRWT